MKRVVGLFLLGLVVVVGGSLPIVGAQMDHFLKGLAVFDIHVPELSDKESKTGLTAERLRTDILLRLRSYGLRPDSKAISPLLVFSISAITIDYAGEDSHYVYSNVCRYMDDVTKNDVRTPAYLWESAGYIGYVSKGDFPERVRGLARDCADDFMAAFLEVNPDFTPPRPSD